METRRRGRDARASTETNRSSSPNTALTTPANNSNVEPPSTRSRTRRTSASNHQSLQTTRTPRPSTSGVVTRSLAAAVTIANTTTNPPDSSPELSTRRASLRSRTAHQQPTVPVRSPTTRTPATRKRTRSAARIETESHLTATDDQGTPASTLPSQPAKRSRRTSGTTRAAKAIHSQSVEVATSQQGASSRRTKSMNSTRPGENVEDGNSSPGNSRQEDDGPNSPGSDRGAPTTLQGLLRRLGADLSDILPGNGGTSHSRLQQLRTAITTPESTEQQVDALSELCEFLSVGTEESLVSFSVNLFVGPLVNLLKTEANVETKIYAARALTHMLEALPSSASAIAINGAAEPLCQNLLSIEYIDLAEQSLSVLHKLSIDYPQQIVSANGFQAVLSFIDFFSIGVQRVAASTVCNLCRLPRSDAMEMISGALPTMMRLLSSEDQRTRESVVLGFTRLAEAFRASSEKLETLCGNDASLLDKVLGLIVPSSPPAISPQSYSSALRLLAILSRGSAPIGLRILSTRSLIEKLHQRLTAGSSMHSVDCLNLADSLLPDLPESESAPIHIGSASTRSRRRRSIGSAAALAAVDTKRREHLEQNAELLDFFGRTLFDTLMKFYVSSADANARRMALAVMSKFIAIASQEVLLDTIEGKSLQQDSLGQKMSSNRFCPFVAALLGENSSRNEALVGLAMAAAALQKLPSFKEDFVREGVIHEIVRLAAVEKNTGKDGSEVGLTPDSGGATTENRTLGQNTARATEENALPTGNLALSNTSVRDVESLWTAVAALQRGTTTRMIRGDPLGGARRTSSRAGLEFRVPATQAVNSVVSRAAQTILSTYLGADSNGNLQEEILKNSVLQRLSSICIQLQAANGSPEHRGSDHAVEGLLDLLTSSEGLTVFEVSNSGILDILSTYLSQNDPNPRAARISSLTKRFQEGSGLEALSSLVALSLGVLSSEEKLSVQTNELSHGTTSASVSSGLRQLTQPFKLRLRKAASETGSSSLRDYSHHVVLIEPLATMASVQEFLWPKVRDSSNPSLSRRQRGSRGQQSIEEVDPEEAHGAEANQTSSPDVNFENQESESPEDRFREIFNMEDENNEDEDGMEDGENDQNSDGSDEDVSSGEEDVIEQDGGESDDPEHDGGDALDVDQMGSSLPPFEVDHEALGQAPDRLQTGVTSRRGGASRVGSGPARPETTFRSYAAALAANIPRGGREGSSAGHLPSDDSRATRAEDKRNTSSPEQRLAFTLNGRPLGQNCSILTAILQSASEDHGIGPRLWSEVHTLSYAKRRSSMSTVPNQRSSPRASRESLSNDGSSSVRRSLRLQENRGRPDTLGPGKKLGLIGEPTGDLLDRISTSDGSAEAPEVLKADLPTSISAIVNILRILYWVYEKMDHVANIMNSTSSSNSGNVDSTIHFVSHRLSAKLMRQLSDPLALCGGAIPSWCFTVAREASFLIPFEARRILFQATSLGVPRALHLLQTRSEMAGVPGGGHRSSRFHREGEARIARIARQKVRVHRNRILESAIKVMNIYSSHGTVLEVEYFGEVGTGLGPTLEFYTLASREIQRIDLGLWRCSTGKIAIQKEREVAASDESDPKSQRIRASRTVTIRRRNRRKSGAANTKADLTRSGNENPPAFVIPTGNGLFPSCLPITASETQREFSEKTTALFAFIGRLVGKAMIDGRLLDLRFSRSFARLLLSYCRAIYEKEKIDGPKENTTLEAATALDRGRRPSRDGLQSFDRKRVWDIFTRGVSAMELLTDVDAQLATSLKAIMSMIQNGQAEAIPSLCLTFVLPGDDSIELVRDGTNKEVNATNAEDFVRRVAYHVLFGGVYQQAEAMLKGLEELMDITNLLVFEDRELELFLCGPSFEKWTVESLVQATRCDHGYSHESSSVLHLLKIMSELDQENQQRFVRFITGSPALPLGGLKNLHPRLTIVRRTPEAGRSPDECLPTVMTCTNYLKLPDYSTFEIAKKQIMYAVMEGQGAFHLS